MSQDNLIKLACTTCDEINYHENKNVKKFRGIRLEKNKFCKRCKQHTNHKERK